MENSSALPIHNRLKISFKKGKGAYLFDDKNQKYLDFGAGIAVNSLGHCHPKLVSALTNQAKKLWHVSNLYQISELEDLAKFLTQKTFADYAFFCNSGAEAVECAIKMIRKHFYHKGQKHKNEVITFKESFHGRTIATISAAGNEKYLEGFDPRLEGFKSAKFNDIESVKKLINDKSAGILVEPVQGEGGVTPATKEFMQDLAKLARENDLLLALDEVQSGVGRSGYLYAYEYYKIKPDIIASAKGIGGGFPVGACLATKEAACGMVVGSHGTTYGGNPLAMSVAKTVVDIISKPDFLKSVQNNGEFFLEELNILQKKFPKIIKEIRGIGLFIGMELQPEFNNIEFTNKLKENHLLAIPAGKNTIRLIPPLIVTKPQIKQAIRIIKLTLKNY